MTDKQIQIDFDKQYNKLTIRCPFWANDLVKNLPNIRWSKAQKAWTVALVRKNVEEVETHLTPHATFTDEALAAIEKAKKTVEKKQAPDVFPFWYRWHTQPKTYQSAACHKLYPLDEYGLFADVGTGKSKMAIDIRCAQRMENQIGAWLIVCKYTLRDNWVEQLETHMPIPYTVYLPETTKKELFDKWLGSGHEFPIMICGTESFSQGGMKELAEKFLMTAFRPAMDIDESSYIAGHDAIRSQELVRLGRAAVKRGALTGTPITESPLNLFMQFEYLNPNIIGIGDYYAFRNRYAVMGGYTPKEGKMKGKPVQVVGYQNLDELIKTISPYIFQVGKDESLPPQRYQKRVIPMTKDQREVYDQIRKEKAWNVGTEEQIIQNALELSLRLQQVCGGFTVKKREVEKTVKGEKRIKKVYDPVQMMAWDENNKCRELLDVLREVKGRQVTVWCAFRPEIDMIRDAIIENEMDPPALYHGGVNDTDRDAYDKGFKSGVYKVMLANQQTGSMGLTWVSDDAVAVYYSNSNKFIDRYQSEGRSHRLGAGGESVLYIDLAMEKSIDLTIMASLKDKKDLVQFMRDRITQATIDDLMTGVLK